MSRLSLDQFEPYFDHNDGIVAGIKYVSSSNRENVGQGHHLQTSLYFSYGNKKKLWNFYRNDGDIPEQ